MRVILLALAILMQNSDGFDFGTTAIAVWTPARVVMSADSKVTRRNDAQVAAYQTCKTRVVGEHAISAAGFYGRPGANFDAWEILERIATTSRNLTAFEQSIRAELAPALARALGDAQQRDPQGFARDFRADFFSVAVARVSDGMPKMVTVNFFPGGNGDMRAETNYYPRAGTLPQADDIGLTIMGEHAAIDRDYPNERLIPALRRDLDNTVQQLVALEIREAPEKVDAPISLVEVTARGPRILIRGVCQ